MRDLLLQPLGMNHSTFDRGRVHATANRAVGHGGLVTPPVDSPMTAAGGLWTTASDLGRFLQFQLGNGNFEGRTVLGPALMEQMRTVPAPDAGAPAGYALGIARTHWRAGQYLDLFDHGGGGNGFITDLWWLPQLQLGVAVLTNSSEHRLQGSLALQILGDLATGPDSPYRDRLLALPTQSDVIEPDSHFVPPPDLAQQIASVALPASAEAPARWARFPQLYRTGAPGAMNPTAPPSRFLVEADVPYFDASEDGTPVRHRLVEAQPGLFLAENGETLDLRGPVPHWRGLHLNPVTGGPLPAQWILLTLVVALALAWLLIAGSTAVRGRVRRGRDPGRRRPGCAGPDGGGVRPPPSSRPWPPLPRSARWSASGSSPASSTLGTSAGCRSPFRCARFFTFPSPPQSSPPRSWCCWPSAPCGSGGPDRSDPTTRPWHSL